MWPQALRRAQATTHRTVRFSRGRSYNGQQHQGPHTTYFQQPPPAKPSRRIFSTILLGTTFFGLGIWTHGWLTDVPFFERIKQLTEEEEMMQEAHMMKAVIAAAQDNMARQVPDMDLEAANNHLGLQASINLNAGAVSHTCSLPSNLPCEDAEQAGAFNLFNDPARDWHMWSIFDGHAGPRTAELLKDILPSVLGGKLWEGKCMDRPYVPNDPSIIHTIKNAFKEIDDELLNGAPNDPLRPAEDDMARTIALLAPAVAGSCALVALFDPARSVLRVANVGDSRAVLGRWDDTAGKYVAVAMSIDQTGFNPAEVERLKQQHPDEDVVDPKTGRVHGLAVSRAFGDARWKWPSELTQLVHDKFWGPSPRPNGVIKTPPYLTAEPEITEIKVQSDDRGGKHPDFLIMASDGLWDNISSEDAVTCVQQWLDKYKPAGFVENQVNALRNKEKTIEPPKRRKQPPPDFSQDSEDDDTYYDENEKCLKWRVSPKHFVVEDEHCGMHLIKNALGGKRRNLFTGVMAIQAPHSRNVRDDITVHVIFFDEFARPLIPGPYK